MKRTILIGLSGLGYFIISLFLFMPFRMKPIENYNTLSLTISFALLLILFLKYYDVLNLLTTIYVAVPVFAIEIFSFFKKRKIDRRI